MPENSDEFKRVPTKPRKVGKIDREEDIRISVIGTLVNKGEDSLVVNDGSGNLEVSFLELHNFERVDELETGQLVRVVGKLDLSSENLRIRGEAVQDFSDFNLDLYKKAEELESEVNK